MGSPYKTVTFQTLGCKLNFAETSTLARDFISHGYAQVGNNDTADYYIINTCSVTDKADKKAKKMQSMVTDYLTPRKKTKKMSKFTICLTKYIKWECSKIMYRNA